MRPNSVLARNLPCVLALSISMALLVRAGSERYVLPLPNIREVVVAARRARSRGDILLLQVDEAIDVVLLSNILGVELNSKIEARPIVYHFEPPPECRNRRR